MVVLICIFLVVSVHVLAATILLPIESICSVLLPMKKIGLLAFLSFKNPFYSFKMSSFSEKSSMSFSPKLGLDY